MHLLRPWLALALACSGWLWLAMACSGCPWLALGGSGWACLALAASLPTCTLVSLPARNQMKEKERHGGTTGKMDHRIKIGLMIDPLGSKIMCGENGNGCPQCIFRNLDDHS